MNSRIANCRSGFTLIEALATFVLIAVIIPVAMRGLGLSVRTGQQARAKIEAAQIAHNKLAEMILFDEWIDGDQDGTIEIDGRDYEWMMQVSGPDSLNVYELNMMVRWDSGDSQRQVSLSTLIYGQQQ